MITQKEIDGANFVEGENLSVSVSFPNTINGATFNSMFLSAGGGAFKIRVRRTVNYGCEFAYTDDGRKYLKTGVKMPVSTNDQTFGYGQIERIYRETWYPQIAGDLIGKVARIQVNSDDQLAFGIIDSITAPLPSSARLDSQEDLQKVVNRLQAAGDPVVISQSKYPKISFRQLLDQATFLEKVIELGDLDSSTQDEINSQLEYVKYNRNSDALEEYKKWIDRGVSKQQALFMIKHAYGPSRYGVGSVWLSEVKDIRLLDLGDTSSLI